MHIVIEEMCIVDTQDLRDNLVKHVTVRRDTKQSIYRIDGVAGETRDKRQETSSCSSTVYAIRTVARLTVDGRDSEVRVRWMEALLVVLWHPLASSWAQRRLTEIMAAWLHQSLPDARALLVRHRCRRRNKEEGSRVVEVCRADRSHGSERPLLLSVHQCCCCVVKKDVVEGDPKL